MPGERKKRFYSSIFFMILCINLCSILVLSIFNYYVFHRLSGKAYLESFLSYNQRVTELAFRNIDNQIMLPVLKIAQLHFSPINENAPLLTPQEEQIAASPGKVLELVTEMRKIQKTYPYLTDIDIYYEGTQTVVTGFDKVHFPTDEARIGQYLPWYGQYRSGTLPEGFAASSGGVYLAEEPVITYIKKISMPKWEGKSIVLAISVSPRGFTEYIDQQGGELSILTTENRLLYDSTGMEDGTRKLAAFQGASDTDEGESLQNSGYDEIHTGEWNMTVFYYVSPVTGLTYLYSLDTAHFYENYNLTSRMFLINFLISIVFNLIVLAVISYYNYTAYRRRVLTLSKKAGIAMGSAGRSFDGSLTQLTKEITDLHAAVQSSKGMVLQNAVRSVLLKRSPEDGMAELAPYLTGESLCAYLISQPEQELEPPEVEALQEAFPPGTGSYSVLFTTVGDSLIALQCFSGDFEGVNKDFLEEMGAHLKNCRVSSGIVCPLKDDGIRTSYKSAVDTERYRYILPHERFLSYGKAGIEKRKESGSHIKLFEAIKKDINNEDLLELKLHVEMLVEAFKTGAYTVEYCNSTLRDLVGLFYQVMQQYQLDMWIVVGYDIREYYKKIPNIDAFCVWCGSLCEMILKNIHQKKASVDTDVRAQVLSLIDENLEKNISLDFLADQLHIRPDAASRTFRQMMGTGYTEYIKTRKLNRALELIEAGGSVKEVADRLGYSTPQYFIKVFKESYGVTPLQYKKKTEQEKHEL